MNNYFCDLHIHIGRNGRNKPVKITASPDLTLENILTECVERKGIQLIGIIDCACTGVLSDIRRLIKEGQLMELPEGGLLHRKKVVLIPGAEIEAVEPGGGVSHHLCYFPFLRNLAEFSRTVGKHITNMELSSQRCGLPAAELLSMVSSTGGIMMVAHAFTPHKGAYGNACRRLKDLFGSRFEELAGVEIGLSADLELAARFTELEGVPLLTNSDAHSLPRIGREVNVLRMKEPNFREMVLALKGQNDRKIVANYGLRPALGRYFRSYCQSCEKSFGHLPPPVLACPDCGEEGRDFTLGVGDRIEDICPVKAEPESLERRPPYHFQVPLSYLNGFGEKTVDRLITHVGSEMEALHHSPRSKLAAAVGYSLADQVLLARSGGVELVDGGGGRYGGVASRGEDGPVSEQLLLFS